MTEKVRSRQEIINEYNERLHVVMADPDYKGYGELQKWWHEQTDNYPGGWITGPGRWYDGAGYSRDGVEVEYDGYGKYTYIQTYSGRID
jgi:hypothetical protein